MNLRAHHLLCLLGFQGQGYSDDFIEKMNELSPLYKNEQMDFLIYINPHTDTICQTCPAVKGQCCLAGDNQVRELDRRVLEHLNIRDNEHYQKSDLLYKIKSQVKPDDLTVLCQGCKWLQSGLCQKGLADFQNQ